MKYGCSKNLLCGVALSCSVHRGGHGQKAGSINTCFANGMTA
jgi:hypothetical protein